MSDCVIKVEELSKRYRLGLVGGTTLQEDAQRWWAKLRGKPDPFLRIGDARDTVARGSEEDPDHIWALREVSFSVNRGEVVGVIGRNGAGKSTLLKILTRITAPSLGTVKLKGRIGSLLEVGTGFHPELTGRENIFLNGAILGMSKREVQSRLDEIVDFAEVETFIDTPVKRYSSGMYVRLAFAVAAHLEPDILLVDEVLAVGDIAFQRKCLGKMGDVAGHGRTVLFVSHNMSSIQKLCDSCILLQNGQLEMMGPTPDVVERYIEQGGEQAALSWQRTDDSPRDMYIERAFLSDESGAALQSVRASTAVGVALDIVVRRPVRSAEMSIALMDALGTRIISTRPSDAAVSLPQEAGHYRVMMVLPDQLLLPRAYSITAALWAPGRGRLDKIDPLSFQVEDDLAFSSSAQPRRGQVAVRCEWSVEKAPSHRS